MDTDKVKPYMVTYYEITCAWLIQGFDVRPLTTLFPKNYILMFLVV